MMPTYSPLEVPAFEAGLQISTPEYLGWTEMISQAKAQCEEREVKNEQQSFQVQEDDCHPASDDKPQS